MNQVILVDTEDNEIGILDKMEAHLTGQLHRAFSIFIFNSQGEMLIHQRAFEKYHSGGLWTNACCSHPQPDTSIQHTLEERLAFEMGMKCDLKFAFTFLYQAAVEPDLIEHELDHIYIGISDISPRPNPDEVANWKYISITHLQELLRNEPTSFTPWFKLMAPQVIRHFIARQ
jgi:isopentenyl-diphosphate Delta-isomerase